MRADRSALFQAAQPDRNSRQLAPSNRCNQGRLAENVDHDIFCPAAAASMQRHFLRMAAGFIAVTPNPNKINHLQPAGGFLKIFCGFACLLRKIVWIQAHLA